MPRHDARDTLVDCDSAEDGLRVERRRHRRVKFDAPVAFEFEDYPMRPARGRSYSESGVFVATNSPPPRGCWVLLRLALYGSFFDVEGLVVRVVPFDGRSEPGFAAELVALPASLRQALRRLVAAAEDESADASR